MSTMYELRLYDKPLLSFVFKRGELGKLDVKIENMFSKDKADFPLGWRFPAKDGRPHKELANWISTRVIPKNRAYVEQILKTFDLTLDDTQGVMDVCMGLSLNDSYWVVPQSFDGRFADYNLYENPFSKVLALVAYTGVGEKDENFSTSPEYTTHGMLPKAWRVCEDGGIYLYKGGTTGASNTGNEPYSEFYAFQIAKRMGLTAVYYDLEEWKERIASKCKLFTDIHTSYVPVGQIVREGGLAAVVKYYDSLGPTFGDGIRDMLVFDALIFNTDRHFGNFGVLRDNMSGGIVAPAPLFDHGMSLFNFADERDFQDLETYAKSRPPAYSRMTFEGIVKELATPRQVEALTRIEGFRFKRHTRFNLSEERLNKLECFLPKRAAQLMDMAKGAMFSNPE